MKTKVIAWTFVGLAALAASCYAYAALTWKASPVLGEFLPAWMLFGWITLAITVLEGLIGMLLLKKKPEVGRMLLLSALIVGLIGPGLCGITAGSIFITGS